MEAQDLSEIVEDMRHQVIDDLVDDCMPPRSPTPTSGSAEELQAAGASTKLGLDVPVAAWAEEEGVDEDEIRERLYKAVGRVHGREGGAVRPRDDAPIEKQVLLQTIDAQVARAPADARASALGRRASAATPSATR